MLTAWRHVSELPRWLQAMLLGQLVSAAGALAMVYLTLYLVQDRGLSAAVAGVVAAGFGAGTIAGNLAGGSLGDRFGLRPSLLASTLGWVVFCAAFPFSPTPALLPVAVLAGAASGASRPLGMAVVLAALPAAQRRTAAAVTRATFNAGMVIGPPLGALAAAHHFSLVFVIDAATSLVLAAVIWRRVPSAERAPAPAGAGETGTRGLWRSLRARPSVLWVLGTVIVIDTVYRQFFVTLPLQLRALHHPPLAYGLLLTGSCVVIVLAEVPISVALGRHAGTSVVATGYALVGAAWLVLGAHPSLGAAVACTVVLTAGEMLYKPTATATVADAAPEGYAGRYQSLYASASVSGLLLGPALGGLAWSHAPRLLWPGAGALGLVTAGLLALHHRRATRHTGLAVGSRP